MCFLFVNIFCTKNLFQFCTILWTICPYFWIVWLKRWLMCFFLYIFSLQKWPVSSIINLLQNTIHLYCFYHNLPWQYSPKIVKMNPSYESKFFYTKIYKSNIQTIRPASFLFTVKYVYLLIRSYSYTFSLPKPGLKRDKKCGNTEKMKF